MLYDDYEHTKGWSEQLFGTYSLAQAAGFENETARAFVSSSHPIRVLDVGFGNGPFLGWARNKGWKCEGVEINPELVARANSYGVEARSTLGELRETAGWTQYDLITAFDVLEHIERDALVPFLASLRSACAANAHILVRFPNGDNPFSLPFQNGDVTHRTHIGQSMLHQLAAFTRMKVVWMGSPRQVYAGFQLHRRVAAALGIPVRWFIGNIIRHLFMGGVPVVFSGNLVAVLAPLPDEVD